MSAVYLAPQRPAPGISSGTTCGKSENGYAASRRQTAIVVANALEQQYSQRPPSTFCRNQPVYSAKSDPTSSAMVRRAVLGTAWRNLSRQRNPAFRNRFRPSPRLVKKQCNLVRQLFHKITGSWRSCRRAHYYCDGRTAAQYIDMYDMISAHRSGYPLAQQLDCVVAVVSMQL